MGEPRHSGECCIGDSGCLHDSDNGRCGSEAPSLDEGLSRRYFLRRAAGSAATGALVMAAGGIVLPVTAQAQTALTPDQALKELADGNARFMAGQSAHFAEDREILKQKTVEKQEPFAAVLSCIDSRVPVELVFDLSIGEVLVARVAGNIATAEIIASLEYGVAVLGTTAIIVLGHRNCGAVKAAIAAKAVPGQISALYPYIRPAVDMAGTDADAVSKANAKIQAMTLQESSPVLADAIKQKKLKIAAGFYDLATGGVEMLA
jgi:carbonic anhydrase